MRAKHVSLLGIAIGLSIGWGLYAAMRVMAPPALGFGSVLIGLSAGIGARLGRAFGTPHQLRIIIFGALVGLVLVESFLYHRLDGIQPSSSFVGYLIADPIWLGMTIIFLVVGLVFGIRLLVGVDPLNDVMRHGGAMSKVAFPSCTACGSNDVVRLEARLYRCRQCDQTFASEVAEG
ncbi:MAG: hypothetical protein VX589_11545 [Myxococcota bacterium]|nr:hypothetical protein [Myxococcota bacterium]